MYAPRPVMTRNQWRDGIIDWLTAGRRVKLMESTRKYRIASGTFALGTPDLV